MASLEMLEMFSQREDVELDTAYMYNDGKTEQLLGQLLLEKPELDFEIATKANPWSGDGLKPDEVEMQLNTSLDRLKKDQIDLFYLHAPDLDTPIEDTLEQCWKLYQAGKFRRFGLSNFSAWQVAEIAEICRSRDWMIPTVYQGMYNALTRDVERELFPCLRNYNISFYVFNPLAGGLLTGKHASFSRAPDSGRFAIHDGYLGRYWKEDYFSVLDDFVKTCSQHTIAPTMAALRWLQHHSLLSVEQGDGIILGASKIVHLRENLESFGSEKLPEEIIEVLDAGWEVVKPDCFKYFRP